MSTTAHISEVLRRVLVQPTRGVTGLVDDLLTLCREQSLQFDWQANRCCVRSLAGDREEIVDVALRKSVFRMILARVAVLCNERTPNSVSPYGGQGELSVGENPPTVFKVTFTNTPAEQKLELTMEPEQAPVDSQTHEQFKNLPVSHQDERGEARLM